MPSLSHLRSQHYVVHEDPAAQAASEWHHDEILLQKRIAWARSFTGSSEVEGLPFRLKRGERVFFVADRVTMVEAARRPGDVVAGYAAYSFRASTLRRGQAYVDSASVLRGAEPLAVCGAGSVVVTDQRVVFTGTPHAREWDHRKLVSVEHDERRPITLLAVSTRRKVSGLAYPLHITAGFQLNLTLAMAQCRGETAAFVAALEQEQAAHRDARPVLLHRSHDDAVAERPPTALARVKALVSTALARTA